MGTTRQQEKRKHKRKRIPQIYRISSFNYAETQEHHEASRSTKGKQPTQTSGKERSKTVLYPQ